MDIDRADQSFIKMIIDSQWGGGCAFKASHNLSLQTWWYVAIVEKKTEKTQAQHTACDGVLNFCL